MHRQTLRLLKLLLLKLLLLKRRSNPFFFPQEAAYGRLLVFAR